jgi:hypothetical protein
MFVTSVKRITQKNEGEIKIEFVCYPREDIGYLCLVRAGNGYYQVVGGSVNATELHSLQNRVVLQKLDRQHARYARMVVSND